MIIGNPRKGGVDDAATSPGIRRPCRTNLHVHTILCSQYASGHDRKLAASPNAQATRDIRVGSDQAAFSIEGTA
ncbi:MAG: hypothetical protein JNL25_08610 [Rhodospirillaceae bacterium]|nr:hypothetical protein [Rhodospirillaceae bacterium]